MTHKTRRFSELRPERVDSNLFQYHLQKLIRDGYVAKLERGYTLSGKGLYFADRFSTDLKAERVQPKIITIIAVRNHAGQVLVLRKPRQPFLGNYHLPAGKLHEMEKVDDGARRELFEKAGLKLDNLKRIAMVHMIIRAQGVLVSEYYGVVMYGEYDGEVQDGQWYDKNSGIELCPGVSEIISLGESPADFFHEWELSAG